jgi:hypothetical protein
MLKLGWFLRDFIYNPELLSQSAVDESERSVVWSGGSKSTHS